MKISKILSGLLIASFLSTFASADSTQKKAAINNNGQALSSLDSKAYKNKNAISISKEMETSLIPKVAVSYRLFMLLDPSAFNYAYDFKKKECEKTQVVFEKELENFRKNTKLGKESKGDTETQLLLKYLAVMSYKKNINLLFFFSIYDFDKRGVNFVNMETAKMSIFGATKDSCEAAFLKTVDFFNKYSNKK